MAWAAFSPVTQAEAINSKLSNIHWPHVFEPFTDVLITIQFLNDVFFHNFFLTVSGIVFKRDKCHSSELTTGASRGTRKGNQKFGRRRETEFPPSRRSDVDVQPAKRSSLVNVSCLQLKFTSSIECWSVSQSHFRSFFRIHASNHS